MRIKFLFSLCFVVVLLHSSCKSKSSIEILTIDSMKMVMWDMLNAGEWNNISISKDSVFFRNHNDIKLFEQVFLIHHINKETFYASYKYYESHPDKMKILIDSVSYLGQREKNKAFMIHQ